jgi:hypothetical protein
MVFFLFLSFYIQNFELLDIPQLLFYPSISRSDYFCHVSTFYNQTDGGKEEKKNKKCVVAALLTTSVQ